MSNSFDDLFARIEELADGGVATLTFKDLACNCDCEEEVEDDEENECLDGKTLVRLTIEDTGVSSLVGGGDWYKALESVVEQMEEKLQPEEEECSCSCCNPCCETKSRIYDGKAVLQAALEEMSFDRAVSFLERINELSDND
jgi:hypothetical protein